MAAYSRFCSAREIRWFWVWGGGVFAAGVGNNGGDGGVPDCYIRRFCLEKFGGFGYREGVFAVGGGNTARNTQATLRRIHKPVWSQKAIRKSRINDSPERVENSHPLPPRPISQIRTRCTRPSKVHVHNRPEPKTVRIRTGLRLTCGSEWGLYRKVSIDENNSDGQKICKIFTI